jgi:hypothetical protein
MSMPQPAKEQRTVKHEALREIRDEYLEMPGLSLTVVQAQRFWSLDHETCTGLLDALVTGGFLTRTANGSYVLADAS